MTFKTVAALTGALALLPSLALAQQSAPPAAGPPDDPRVPHFAMAFEMQRVLKQCRVANTPVTAAQIDQKVSQLATAIGAATAKDVRDEVGKEKVECPKPGEEVEGFKSMLTLVATKSSEEVAKALESDDEPPQGQPGGAAPPPANQPPAGQQRR